MTLDTPNEAEPFRRAADLIRSVVSRPTPRSRRGPGSAARRGYCVCASLVVVAAHALLGRLGPTRRLGHDDLVDAQHSDGSLGGELDRLLLCVQQVKHAALASAALNDVDTLRRLAALVRGVHLSNHVGRVEAGVL